MTYSIFTSDEAIQNLKNDFTKNLPMALTKVIVKVNTGKRHEPTTRIQLAPSKLFPSFIDKGIFSNGAEDNSIILREGSPKPTRGTFIPYGSSYTISSAIVASPKRLCKFISSAMGTTLSDFSPLAPDDIIDLARCTSDESRSKQFTDTLCEKFGKDTEGMSSALFDWLIAVLELYFVNLGIEVKDFDEVLSNYDEDAFESLIDIARNTRRKYTKKKYDKFDVKLLLSCAVDELGGIDRAKELGIDITINGIDILSNDFNFDAACGSKKIMGAVDRGSKWLKIPPRYLNHPYEDFMAKLLLAQYMAPWKTFGDTGYRDISRESN